MTNYAAAAMSFAGTMESARAQANTDKYNAQVAENNADAIENQGTAAVEAQARQFRAQLGSMEASYGGSGVDTSMGSPLDALGASVRAGTLDQLTTKYNYTVAANSQRDQARLDRLGARNAITAGFFNAQANALSAFGSGQVNSGGYGSPRGYASGYNTPVGGMGGMSAFDGNAIDPNTGDYSSGLNADDGGRTAAGLASSSNGGMFYGSWG